MLRKCALVIIFLTFSGCAVSPHVVNQSAVNSAKGYTTITVEVNSVNTIDDDDLPKAKQELIEDLMAKINVATTLHPVDNPSKADLKVLVLIKNLRYVSGGHRFWMGTAAGHATLTAYVKLVDMKTGNTLWTINVDTTSSGWSGIFGADSSNQLDMLSNQIVNGIKDNI